MRCALRPTPVACGEHIKPLGKHAPAAAWDLAQRETSTGWVNAAPTLAPGPLVDANGPELRVTGPLGNANGSDRGTGHSAMPAALNRECHRTCAPLLEEEEEDQRGSHTPGLGLGAPFFAD